MTNYYRDMSRDEFEVAYNARLQVPSHEDYVAQNEMLSAEYRSQANAVLDLGFGDRPLECLDLFLPAAAEGPAPVHLFIHGGYWRSRTKESFSFLARPLVERGAVVAVTSYSLCPDVRVRDIVDEMRRAVLWLHANVGAHGGDPDALHVSGHSAGGHLAAMLALTDWKAIDPSLPHDLVKSSVPISGLFELAPMMLHSINDTLHLDDDEVAVVSPSRLKPAHAVPMSVFVGGDESDLFQEQSTGLCDAWRDVCGDAMGPHVLKGHNHFSILSDLKSADFVITRTLLGLMGLAVDAG